MITILSPAKNLNFNRTLTVKSFTLPEFSNESKKIMKSLLQLDKSDLTELMDISPKLADLNFHRYRNWSFPDSIGESRQAILSFNGEVYNGLKAWELEVEELNFAQQHVRILSGLHGVLRPLDLIKPYRLEMGIRLSVAGAKDLYRFWGNKINKFIKKELENQNNKTLINLASEEYSKAVNLKKITRRIITPVFKELRGEDYKTIIIYAKKARGLMTRFIIDNRINDPEQLKHFDLEGYAYTEQLSDKNKWTFTRY